VEPEACGSCCFQQAFLGLLKRDSVPEQRESSTKRLKRTHTHTHTTQQTHTQHTDPHNTYTREGEYRRFTRDSAQNAAIVREAFVAFFGDKSDLISDLCMRMCVCMCVVCVVFCVCVLCVCVGCVYVCCVCVRGDRPRQKSGQHLHNQVSWQLWKENFF